MISKYLWHSFADSRRPSPIDQRLERQAQQLGVTGQSSPLPQNAKVVPTAREVEKAREKASGGKKDRCNKGTSCGAACIHANDRCLQEFPAPMSEGVRSLSKVLSDRLDRGEISGEEAEQVISELKGLSKSQLEAYAKFKSLVESGKVSEAEKEQVANLILSTIMVTGQDKKAVRLMSFDDVEAVLKPGKLESLQKAYDNSFSPDGKFDPSRPGAMGDYIQKSLIYSISDEVAGVAYRMLSSEARRKLDGMGSPPEGRTYGGDDENGNPIFVKGPNSTRGVFMAKRFMEQGGIDPYTGKRINILSSEAEHMVASSHVSSKSGSADQPRNLLWADPTGNNSKAGAGDDFTSWGEALRKIQRGGREKYLQGEYGKALARSEKSKGAKAAAPTELAKALSLQSPRERVEALRQLIKIYKGDEVRYLLRAVGMQSGQWESRRPHTGRPNRVILDNNASLSIKGKTVKPSEAILIAASTLDPTQRAIFLNKVDALRMARQMGKQEVDTFESTSDPRYIRRKKELDEQFESNLTSLLQSVLPDLSIF